MKNEPIKEENETSYTTEEIKDFKERFKQIEEEIEKEQKLSEEDNSPDLLKKIFKTE